MREASGSSGKLSGKPLASPTFTIAGGLDASQAQTIYKSVEVGLPMPVKKDRFGSILSANLIFVTDSPGPL